MSGRRSVMARITALTAPIVTTLAMSRLTAATVVCVSAAVWGASQRDRGSVKCCRPISAVIVLAVFWVLATLVRRVAVSQRAIAFRRRSLAKEIRNKNQGDPD